MEIIDDSIKIERKTIIARKNREWFPGGVTTMCEVLDRVEEKGKEIGKEIGRMETYFGLVKDGLLEVSQASRRCQMSEEEFLREYEKYCKKY